MPSTLAAWNAATTAPGLGPATEAEMTDAVARSRDAWWPYRQDPDFVAREIVGPLGVADLVAIRFDHSALRTRAAAGIRAVGDYAALSVVMACRRSSLRCRDLAEVLGLSDSAVRRAVRAAYEKGVLEDGGGGRHRTHPAWAPLSHRMVAAELKRVDWRRAVAQVWAYQEWANSAWLVLGRQPPLSALQGLAGTGMGLAYLDETEAVRVVMRPTSKRAPSRVATTWAAEQALEHALASGFDPVPVPRARSTRGRAMSRGAQALPAG
jgi:hypothetical protein